MFDTPDDKEKERLNRIAGGDEKSFEGLVADYADLLHTFLLPHIGTRLETDELVQDIFLQIWQTRETLTEIRNFKPFLFVVARNYAWDELKKQLRRQKRHQEWEKMTVISSSAEPGDLELARLSIIQEAIGQLPPQQLKVWVLSRREGLKYTDIAKQMGISRETVKSYLQLANTSIIKHVTRKGGLLTLLVILKNL